ncbi:MAG: cell division protein SepF [Candidatus Thorarchaeota archaeon]|nr:cell division protein SepF [Candidatus Thorarchaeota archaeon]
MRYVFRRSKDAARTEESPTVRSTSMGLFAPSVEAARADPMREQKRLSELDAIFIRSKRLESLDDVPFVVNEVRDGNIVLLDITRLNKGDAQSHLELKRIIERIRGATRAFSADIALVNDGCVIVTPSFVKM